MLVTSIIRQSLRLYDFFNIEVDCEIRAFTSLPERYNIVVFVKDCSIPTL